MSRIRVTVKAMVMRWQRRGCIDIYWHRWKETLKHEVHRQVLAAMEGHTEEWSGAGIEGS